MFYCLRASIGLILLILLLIIELEIRAMDSDKKSIGRNATGLNEKWKFIDKALPTSKLAAMENKNSSKLATTNDTKHWIKEW